MKLKIMKKNFLKILLGLFILNSTIMAETSKKLIFSLDEKKFLEAKLQNIRLSTKRKIDSYSSDERKELLSKGIDSAITYVEKRLDMFGILSMSSSSLFKFANKIGLVDETEVTIVRNEKNQIVLNFKNIKKDFSTEDIVNFITTSKYAEFLAVDEKRDSKHKNMSSIEIEKSGDIVLSSVDDSEKTYLLKRTPLLNNSMIEYAQVGYSNSDNSLLINIHLNKQGRKNFSDFTSKNIGKRVAIVVDKKVMTAPVIREKITEGNVQITGSFLPQEANDIAHAIGSEYIPLIFEK